MDLLFSNKVTQAFADKVNSIAAKLGVLPDWLMFVMNYETAGTFSASVQNSIGATGLIQFLPSTAKSLGTTTDALKAMTAEQQLDFVYNYLLPYRRKMTDYYNTYLTVFYPAAIGKPDTYMFPSDVVKYNPSFFKTGNTLADFKKGLDAIVYAKVPTQYYDEFFKKKEIFCKSITGNSSLQA